MCVTCSRGNGRRGAFSTLSPFLPPCRVQRSQRKHWDPWVDAASKWKELGVTEGSPLVGDSEVVAAGSLPWKHIHTCSLAQDSLVVTLWFFSIPLIPESPSGSPVYPHVESLFSTIFIFPLIKKNIYLTYHIILEPEEPVLSLVLLLTFSLHSDSLSMSFPTSLISIQQNNVDFNYNIEHFISCILSLLYLHFHLRPFHFSPVFPMSALLFLRSHLLRIPNSFLTFFFWFLRQIIIRGKCFF